MCSAFLTLLPSVISTSLNPLVSVSSPWYSNALANKYANSCANFPPPHWSPPFTLNRRHTPTPTNEVHFILLSFYIWKSNRQLSPTVLPFTYCSSFISRWLMFIFLQNKNRKKKNKKKKEFRHNLYTPNPNHTPPFNPSRTNTLTWEPNF